MPGLHRPAVSAVDPLATVPASGAPAKTMAFVDRRHEACDGEGCGACHGGGLVGSLEEIEIFEPAPEVKAQAVRLALARVAAGVPFRVAASRLGVTVVEWCNVERGRRVPATGDWSPWFAAVGGGDGPA